MVVKVNCRRLSLFVGIVGLGNFDTDCSKCGVCGTVFRAWQCGWFLPYYHVIYFKVGSNSELELFRNLKKKPLKQPPLG